MSTLTRAEVLAELPDPRSRHGRFHPLPAVLNLVVLGLLMGRKSFAAIARLGRAYASEARARPMEPRRLRSHPHEDITY